MRMNPLLLAAGLAVISTVSYGANNEMSAQHLLKAGRALPVVSKERRVTSDATKKPLSNANSETVTDSEAARAENRKTDKASKALPRDNAKPIAGGITLRRQAVPLKNRQLSNAAKTNASKTKLRPKRADTPTISQKSGDFSIFDSWVSFDNDADGDGYYSEFTLGFDVDTIYSVADVYADIYISENGGPWELLDTTSVFTIHGAENDGIEISYVLNSGYLSNSYDILIDVYENGFPGIVDTASPDTDNDLFDLPLEDKAHELFTSPVTISYVASELYADSDGDGFYTQMRLEYDIESTLAGDWVYAEIVITSTIDGARQIINTEAFELDSHTEILELSFDTGYLPGWYDVQINLVNDYTGETFGAAGSEFSALRDLPLESKSNDNVYDDPHVVDEVVVVEAGGGSLTWTLILLLGVAGYRRVLAVKC